MHPLRVLSVLALGCMARSASHDVYEGIAGGQVDAGGGVEVEEKQWPGVTIMITF